MNVKQWVWFWPAFLSASRTFNINVGVISWYGMDCLASGVSSMLNRKTFDQQSKSQAMNLPVQCSKWKNIS